MTASLAGYIRQSLTAEESERKKAIALLHRMFGMGVISEEELLRNLNLLRNGN